MSDTDHSYFARRFAEEKIREERASCAAAKTAHSSLASLYAARLASFEDGRGLSVR